MISPLFTTIVIVAGFIFIFMRYTSSKPDSGMKQFLARERRANNTLRQPLDDLAFVKVPLESVPAPDPAVNEKCASLIGELKQLSDKKIVNLTGISNTDLKLTYGAPNLPILSEYDQNFTNLCQILYNLGMEYKNAGFPDEAIAALNAGINVGTDLSRNYIDLAEMYAEKGLFVEIQRLINCAGNIRSITKNSTIRKLQEILDSHTSTVINLSDGEEVSGNPGNILPEDILDILETVPYTSDGQN
ncbi:MAG: hypothetical protein K6F73_09610 [Lachnospiraceae bacterium]|nr:hypothetical protein [Lachnospiraceae bacterium]